MTRTPRDRWEGPLRVAILTTGGTIEKTYDETDGSLRNVRSVLDRLLDELRLPDLQVTHVPVMNKDSLDMTPADRDEILAQVRDAVAHYDAVLVIHGTDTLAETGEHLATSLPGLAVPVVLTGAMRPFEFRDSDALQNVNESLLAARLLAPGVYVVMHGRALAFPGVTKNRERRTFTRSG
ncbi:MAG: asparaginase [Polyangiaceae bacterium]|nr:asparaginase [Myxococcales bacterium]MCC6901840.1 asparaginase [Polyangiaceae bacterium]